MEEEQRHSLALSRSTFWGVTACLLGAYVLVRRVLTWWRLRHVPGPTVAAWTSLWLINKTWQGKVFESLGQVCERYGPIARIAPNHVLCGDPAQVRRMWAPRSQFRRAPWYKGFQLDPPNDCTLSMRDDDIHAVLRAKIAPGYGGKDVDDVENSVDTGIARFVGLIEEKYLSTQTEYLPVDFARKVQFMTLDVISKIAFGEAFGFIDADEDLYGYIKTTEDTVPMMQMFALIPWLIGLLQSPICKAMMPSERDTVGLGPIMATANRYVGQRFTSDAKDRRDMLGSFVRHGLTQREAQSESLVQIIAGSDTTATVLRTLIANVITRPGIYSRLQAEIDDAAATGTVSSPITDAEARKLPYLQACIKEALRIWPPITGIMPRISDEDAVICGVYVPAGTNIAWSAHAVMRNKDIFGVDAEVYRPSRWIDANADQTRAMDNTVDLCFGQGKWGCLGRPIALLELNKMVPELFRRFDFTSVDVEKPIRNTFVGVLIQSEMYLKITRRDSRYSPQS
ncbi:cytochrome p450 domain-containing protein [Sarocladium implicatum]|nr:cytochrome p450 domain-containing protein [Sarocladium implicatum]